MRLATAAEMRRMDERAEKEFGLSRLLLMENAGLSVVLAMERKFGTLEGKRVVLFCGRGGNGGDGFCAARHLVSHGASIAVGLIWSGEDLKGEARTNWEILDKMAMTPREIKADSDLNWVRAACAAADLIVDALLGTGSRLPISGTMEQVVRAINESGKPVVAVDAPSGLDVDTGAVEGACIRADLTVSLGLPKLGQVLYPGALYTGKLVVADLTLPVSLITDSSIGADILLPEEAAELVPVRFPQVHKHEVGRALIVAGSRTMSGAAVLASEGALIAGAGMVYLASPGSALQVMSGRRPEILLMPLAESPSGGVSEAALSTLTTACEKMHAVGLGPGLGLEDTTKRMSMKLYDGVSAPMVIDADALTALAGAAPAQSGSRGERVLTPHSQEMARLLNTSTQAVESSRPGSARAAASRYNSVVVLKGARTIVAEPGGRLFVIPSGNQGLASAGTGDVLTGVITALLAQRLPALSAAILGAYVHGLAGDLARDAGCQLSVTASDVVSFVPKAFKRLMSGSGGASGAADGIRL